MFWKKRIALTDYKGNQGVAAEEEMIGFTRQ